MCLDYNSVNMSNILYYSKYCEHSKKLIGHITSNSLQDGIHFICIDKRFQDPATNKVYILLDNGDKIIMPENVQSVPAMLLLKENYRVIYGDEIYNHVKPIIREQVKQSTQNNMEPSCFSFQGDSGGFGGVMSDNYSFLDQSSEELGTKGHGGMRQMYNYSSLNDTTTTSGSIQTPTDDFDYATTSGNQNMTVEQLQKMREEEFSRSMKNQGQGI